jgi:hypothetical protein
VSHSTEFLIWPSGSSSTSILSHHPSPAATAAFVRTFPKRQSTSTSVRIASEKDLRAAILNSISIHGTLSDRDHHHRNCKASELTSTTIAHMAKFCDFERSKDWVEGTSLSDGNRALTQEKPAVASTSSKPPPRPTKRFGPAIAGPACKTAVNALRSLTNMFHSQERLPPSPASSTVLPPIIKSLLPTHIAFDVALLVARQCGVTLADMVEAVDEGFIISNSSPHTCQWLVEEAEGRNVLRHCRRAAFRYHAENSRAAVNDEVKRTRVPPNIIPPKPAKDDNEVILPLLGDGNVTQRRRSTRTVVVDKRKSREAAEVERTIKRARMERRKEMPVVINEKTTTRLRSARRKEL